MELREGLLGGTTRLADYGAIAWLTAGGAKPRVMAEECWGGNCGELLQAGSARCLPATYRLESYSTYADVFLGVTNWRCGLGFAAASVR